MNRVYYFASCKNGYDRGYIKTNEEESLIDRIHQALDLIGFDKDRIVHICSNSDELTMIEEKHLEKDGIQK